MTTIYDGLHEAYTRYYDCEQIEATRPNVVASRPHVVLYLIVRCTMNLKESMTPTLSSKRKQYTFF